jgi:hypothetical protein
VSVVPSISTNVPTAKLLPESPNTNLVFFNPVAGVAVSGLSGLLLLPIAEAAESALAFASLKTP